MRSDSILIEAEIVERRVEAEAVVSLVLAPASGTAFPAFTAGAHVDVHIAPGLVRQYSLAGDPSETRRYLLGVLLEPASRGGSRAVHETFQVGRRIQIGPPRNNFPLAEQAPYSMLLAGGIGITPLISMAHRLHALGRRFELHYCCRSRSRAAFLEHFAVLPFKSALHLHLDDGPSGERLDCRKLLGSQGRNTHLYVCGPEGFIDHVVSAATEQWWANETIHVEHFGATAPQVGDKAFTVVLASSGKEIYVPEDCSMADMLIANGANLSVSCEQGLCGTCLIPVLSGVPDHRDIYQTDDQKAANTHVTPCCSRSRSERLVLDL